jgi:micrococcal nuclease
MSLNLYHYKAEVLSVYDGDTITVMIDQGMKHFARVKVRMIGINTPEIRTKDLEEKARGYAAKDYLKSRIEGKTIVINTVKKGKFGRWLGVIWLYEEGMEELGESLNDEMIRMGHAVAYDGGAR